MTARAKKLIQRTYLVYGGAALLGALLSSLVYFDMANVSDTTRRLVKQQLPALTTSQNIAAGLSEQERILYEYYATEDESLYGIKYRQTHLTLTTQIDKLAQFGVSAEQLMPLKSDLAALHRLSEEIDANLASGQTDWDLARDQLEKLTALRAQMLPQLEDISAKIDGDVKSGYRLSMTQLSQTSWGVLAFALVLFVGVVWMGRYIGRYIRLNLDNTRLALFAERNPRPVFSLTPALAVEYQNPATLELLQRLEIDSRSPLGLLSERIAEQLEQTRVAAVPVLRFEHQVKEYWLSYEVHWLADMDTFDVHLEDITARKTAEQRLAFKAYHHDSSGLFNRSRLFLDATRLMGEGTPFTLALIAIQNYPQLVRQLGISSASLAVKAGARQLDKLLESEDNRPELYHVGDAEFISLNATGDVAHSCSLLTKLVRDLARPLDTPAGKIGFSLRCGVTEFPRHGDSVERMLLDAQIALDSSDAAVNRFDKELGSLHLYRQTLHRELELALDAGELELHFQPQQDLLSGGLSGAEALIRWNRSGEFVSPAEFIPLAEQSGFILRLGDWILEQACRTLSGWQREGHGKLHLAVNISPRQFAQPGFVERVEQLLDKYRLMPGCLVLEITEGILMEGDGSSLDTLNRLKLLGVSLSIDDFGTGYSSLAYLQRFPVDKLKIDQSFVRNMHESHAATSIVLSICQLATNLNLKVVAEGVEQASQLTLLKDYQCDTIQGYFYSKPLNESDFLAFVEGRSEKVKDL